MATPAAHGPTAPPPPPPGTGPRRLVRRPDEGHLAGVCAGLAEYFNVDPVIVRIAAVVLAFAGPGIFAYLAAWVFVPAADGSMLVPRVPAVPTDRHTQVVGIGLILLAVLAVSGGWWWWSPTRHLMVPLALLAVGAWLLLRRDRGDDVAPPPVPPTPGGPGSPWAWPMPPGPTSVVPAPLPPAGTTGAPTAGADPSEPSPPTEPTSEVDPTVGSASASTPLAELGERAGGVGTDGDALAGDDETAEAPAPGWAAAGGEGGPPTSPDDATSSVPWPPPVPPVPERRRRRFLGPLVFGALLIWGGVAWLGGVEVQDALAIGLCLLGGGFVLGAFVGGSRALVLPALLVGAALVVTSTVDIPWDAGMGERSWSPQRVGELDRSYELGIGEATLDLRDLDLAASTRRQVDVRVGVGHLLVLLPDDVEVRVSGHAGAGDVELGGEEDDGVDVDVDRTAVVRGRELTDIARLAPEVAAQPRARLDLDLEVGMGHIEVRAA